MHMPGWSALMADQKSYPLQVQDVMTRDVITLTPHQPFAQALALLARHRFRHLLVTDTDARVVGILSDRDMLRFMSRGTDLDRATVAEVMRHAVVTVPPKTVLSEAAAQMLSRRINCLPVVENGCLCGILTSTDLLQAFQHVQKNIEQQTILERTPES